MTRTVPPTRRASTGWSSCPVGTYELTVTLGRFRHGGAHRASSCRSASRSELNFALKVAAVAETVTVQADAPIIETTKSAIGANITTRQIDELPLLGAQLPEPHLPDARNHDERHRGGDRPSRPREATEPATRT